jgi:oligopeptide transport system substrate-binding protein
LNPNNKHKLLVYLVVLGLFLGLGCQLVALPTATSVPSPTATATFVPTVTSSLSANPGPTATFTSPPATVEAKEPTSTSVPSATPTLPPTEASGESELRLYNPGDPETLDPALVQDMSSHRFVSLLFSGLVTLNSDLQVVGDLAESWEVDDTGTVYTFHLRHNAKFHNGRQVTAEDVIYSIERACDPERGSVQRAQSYLDDIVGVPERTRGETHSISGLKMVDDFTVEITIDAPKPYFLSKLTYPTSYVVNKENVEDTQRKWTAHPIGTGPFEMVENGVNRMVLGAFDDYYRGRPKIDKLTFEYRGNAVNLYERGELDVVSIGADYVDRALDPNDPLHADLRVVPQLDVWYIGFNTNMPPFDDPHVRRALAYATNKKAIAEIAFNKTVIPAEGILPPGMPGYNPDLEGIPYDPELAAEEMAQSTYGDVSELPPIVLTVSGAGTGEMLSEMYAQALGVNIEVQVVDWNVYLSGLDRQEYQMYSLGWIGDYPDPQNFLDMLFHSGSAYNHGGYNNPELDALVEQARVEGDRQERLALYQSAEELLVQDAVWIPLYHSAGHYLVKPYVKDLVISSQETLNLDQVYVER